MADEMSVTCWIGEDLAVDVLYEVHPGEPEILYPNDKAHPGCEPEIILNQVIVNGSDILDCLTEKTTDQIHSNIQEYMKGCFE